MKESKNKEDKILEEVIIGYRNVINQRYNFKKLEKKYSLPETIDEKLVSQIKDYFLGYIYPGIEKRKELNAAFQSLDDYVRDPKKLFRILVDSSRLLFRYGVHLPKILNTGLKALNTFKAARKFEEKLAEKAREKRISPPYKLKKINTLIESISRKEIEDFIDNCKRLFETLHNRKLVKTIKEILSYLIKKMKEKEEFYTSNEIRGIELGLELLLKGDLLFNELSKEDQEGVVELVIKIERDALDEIYK
ncbi:MAG: hypothetical protein ACI85Q_001811 [Salibacteraceae bacterium]|jgi:hypothetical protein